MLYLSQILFVFWQLFCNTGPAADNSTLTARWAKGAHSSTL